MSTDTTTTETVRADGGPIEELDALVIGAGLSGIAAGHHLKSECPWADFAIFEARDDLGGTWDLFRYPGIRSDSDMYTLGFPFRPWRGSNAIGSGGQILSYLRDTVQAEGLAGRIRYRHRVLAADWSTTESRWIVTAERQVGNQTSRQTNGNGPAGDDQPPTTELITVRCKMLVSCTGYYRYDRGHQPDFPGLDRFEGTFVHPQFWPEDLDYAGKKVVVVGSGATAVTLIPAMADQVERITMLQRSPTYIASLPGTSPVAGILSKTLPAGPASTATRWWHALASQAFYEFCRRWPQRAKRLIRWGVARELPEGYDVDAHFTPAYDPWDQRLCLAPDGDFFAAIRDGKADVVTDRIAEITESGLTLESGRELEADIIVSATGLEMLFLGGMDITVDGTEVDPSQRYIWKGMMLEGVPNAVVIVGYTNASWTLKADMSARYAARLLDELRRRGLGQATPVVDNDGDDEAEPLMGLSSGYIQRAQHLFPRQGRATPWRLHQSYLKDYRAMKMAPVVDEGLELSNPVDAHQGDRVAAS